MITILFFLYFYPVKVDRSAGSTLTVMKIFKFTATARFVRFVLPPFQETGKEQPVYKVELYGCPDEGKTNGKSKKGKYNRTECTRTEKQKAYIDFSLVSLSLVPLSQSHSLRLVCPRNFVHLFFYA